MPDKTSFVRFVFVTSTDASALAPPEPKLLKDKFKPLRVVLVTRMAESDSAPPGPRLLQDKSKSFRILFVSSAAPSTAEASSISPSPSTAFKTVRNDPKLRASSM